MGTHCTTCRARLGANNVTGLCRVCAASVRWGNHCRATCANCGVRVKGRTRTGYCCACAPAAAKMSEEVEMMLLMGASASGPGQGRPQQWCASGCGSVAWADTDLRLCCGCYRRESSRRGNLTNRAKAKPKVCRVCGVPVSKRNGRCRPCAARQRAGEPLAERRAAYLRSAENVARLRADRDAAARMRRRAIAAEALALPAEKRGDWCWMLKRRDVGMVGAFAAVGRRDLAERFAP